MDLNALSLAELKTLQNQVAKAIENFEDRRRKEALVELEAKAKELGFSLDELTTGKKATRPAIPPKYRNPEDAAITWSGRGRKPEWFKAAMAAGKSPEDLLI